MKIISKIVAESIETEMSRDYFPPNNLDKEVPFGTKLDFIIYEGKLII